jgi:hypothetical protein
MRPTTTRDCSVFEFEALLHPGTVYAHPRDVVSDPALSLAEKRTILTSWASDASAIASCPALRAPEGPKAPVHIDEILEAYARWTAGQVIRLAESPCVALDRAASRSLIREDDAKPSNASRGRAGRACPRT